MGKEKRLALSFLIRMSKLFACEPSECSLDCVKPVPNRYLFEIWATFEDRLETSSRSLLFHRIVSLGLQPSFLLPIFILAIFFPDVLNGRNLAGKAFLTSAPVRFPSQVAVEDT